MPKLNHDFRAHSLLNSGVLLNSITTMFIKTAKLKTVSERQNKVTTLGNRCSMV